MLGVIWGEVIDNLRAMVDLPDDQPSSGEDHLIQLVKETEEVGVKCDAFPDTTMKILNIIVGLESMHEH